MRGFLLLFGLAAASAGFAVEPTRGVSAVASYSGLDRTERLVAAAKKEGELMLYSSLTQDDQLKLVADFKRRYAVTVKFWRGSQAHILQRVLSETRGAASSSTSSRPTPRRSRRSRGNSCCRR